MDEREDDTSTTARLAETEKALRRAGREMKWWQIELEHTTEALQRTRRQRARLREQVEVFSEALADTLSARFWESRSSGGSGVGRLLGRAQADPEADLVREVEASDLFDGAWYLRTHPKAVTSGLSPAQHYVRHGNARRLDPGPGFHVARYVEKHPEAAGQDLPLLLHATRNGHLDDLAAEDAPVSPAHDVHL